MEEDHTKMKKMQTNSKINKQIHNKTIQINKQKKSIRIPQNNK